MKIILAMVMSVDGKTTEGNNPNIYDWTSQEDKTYFSSLIENNNVIIMGRKTFMVVKAIIKPSAQKLRIVLTANPDKYQEFLIPGQVEFSNDSPERILNKLEKKGYEQALLVGGESLNGLFLKAKVVNEIWLTIEPKIFGFGNGLVGDKKQNISLKLKSVEKLNRQGTLLLKYKVL